MHIVAIEEARFLAHDSPNRAIGLVVKAMYFGMREVYIDTEFSAIKDLYMSYLKAGCPITGDCQCL